VLTSKFLGPGSIGGITDTIKNVARNQEAKKDPNLKDQSKFSIRNLSYGMHFLETRGYFLKSQNGINN
jgi:hypothetical protein